MVVRADLKVESCDSVWRPGTIVPVYRVPTGLASSAAFYHDHRYVCSQAGITWLYQFRKQEVARNVFGRVLRQHGLETHDVMRNEDKSRRLPILMSTPFTFAWVSTRWEMALFCGQRTTNEYRNNWSSLIRGAGASCAVACQSGRLDGTAGFEVGGVQMSVGPSAVIQLNPLLDAWPMMRSDWDELARVPANDLHAFREEVRADDLWRFFILRLRAAHVPDTHPLHSIRTALMNIIGFLLNVATQIGTEQTASQFTDRVQPVLEIFGPSGRHRCQHRSLQKSIALKRLAALPALDFGKQ